MEKKLAVLGVIIIAAAGLVFGAKLYRTDTNLKTTVSLTKDLKGKVDSLSKENEEYKLKVLDLQSQSSDLDIEKQNLKGRLTEAQNDLSAARDELKAGRETIARLEKELVPVRELKKKLSEKEKAVKQAESEARISAARVSKMEKDLLAADKNLEKAQEQLNTVISKTEQKIRASQKKDADKSQADLAATKNYIKVVEKERDDNLVRIAELKQNLNDTLSRLNSVTTENGGLRQEVADMHYNLGVILTRQNDFRTAIKEFERVVQLKPDDADAHYNLAILYDEKMRDNDKALEHYRAYLKISPNSKDAQKVSKWVIDKESENKVRN